MQTTVKRRKGKHKGKNLPLCTHHTKAIAMHIDTEDKLSTQIEYAGQNRAVTVINESGLYSLMPTSKTPGNHTLWIMKSTVLTKSNKPKYPWALSLPALTEAFNFLCLLYLPWLI